MQTNKEIMDKAYDSLDGKRAKCAILFGVLAVASIVFSFAESMFLAMGLDSDTSPQSPEFLVSDFVELLVFFAGYYIVSWILGIGCCRIFYDIFQGKNFQLNLLFAGFKKLVRNLCVGVIIFAGSAVLWAIMAIPMFGFALCEAKHFGVFFAFFMICCLIACVIMYKLLPTVTLLAYVASVDEDSSCIALIGRTYKLVSKYNWKFWCLSFRFTGWFILAQVTFGIAWLFVGPYMGAAFAGFLQDLQKAESEKQASLQALENP